MGKDKAIDDLRVALDKFYSQIQNALDNVSALNTTIEMSKELVRIRKKSFTEGMATSTEVVGCRSYAVKSTNSIFISLLPI